MKEGRKNKRVHKGGKKGEKALYVELPTPCNLLWERGRRSQGEGNTQQGGSSGEQRPFAPAYKHTLRCNTHTHAQTLLDACSRWMRRGRSEGGREAFRNRGASQRPKLEGKARGVCWAESVRSDVRFGGVDMHVCLQEKGFTMTGRIWEI